MKTVTRKPLAWGMVFASLLISSLLFVMCVEPYEVLNKYQIDEYVEEIVAGKVHAAAPTITSQPEGAGYNPGDNVTPLSVTAESPDGGALSYQWYRNSVNSYEGGEPVGDAAAATYTPPIPEAITETETTWYWVIVTNTNTEATGRKTAEVKSSIVNITVSNETIVDAETPVISSQPVGAEYEGDDSFAPLSVSAGVTDGGTLSYQWYTNSENSYENGTPVDGADGDSYTPIAPTSSGVYITWYWVVVTNKNDQVNGRQEISVQSGIVSVKITIEASGGGDAGFTDPVALGEPIITDFSALSAGGGKAVNINPETEFQTMKGFGASDCWDGNWVGQYWEEPVREQISRWLFSQKLDSGGNPEGIGLSQWRVNLGAGSWEQGLNSNGNPEVSATAKLGNRNFNANNQVGRWDRRAESFLADIKNPSAGYNWNKQLGQQYFFKKAKDMGTETLIAFSNSPVVSWTKSGTANNVTGTSMDSSGKYTKYGSGANLKDDSYDDFAKYMADVAAHFSAEGYHFDYISPVNEPQWDWNEDKQEGTPWTNAEIIKMGKELNTAIQANSQIAGKTKIMLAESAQWDHAYSNRSPSGKTDQIYELFKAASGLTGLPAFQPRVFAGHTYYTHDNDSSLKTHREGVKNKTKESWVNTAQYGEIEIFSSEWCLLTNGEGLTASSASAFDIALYMAKLAHCDITIAGAGSWAFWTAMDFEGTSRDRYMLIGLSPGSTSYNPTSYENYTIMQSGSVQSMPTLWALGAYSLFVRPGFKRISLAGNGFNANNGDGTTAVNWTGLMGTAYKSPEGYTDSAGKPVDRVVAVWVNWGTSGQKMAARFTGGRKPRAIRIFKTDASNTNTGGFGMRSVPHDNGVFTVDGRSIYTVVYDF
jgi:O-glycosyl hydrolase